MTFEAIDKGKLFTIFSITIIILYLVVEKLETPTSGKEAIVKEPIHPTATILAVVDKRRRLH